MENGTKLRLLYLYQHLVKSSDQEHPISTSQLMEDLKQNYGIVVNRNTMANDLNMLNQAGLRIEVIHDRQNLYYYDGQVFDLAELKILIDAVSSSKFITEKKSKDLIGKILSLTNGNGAEKLRRHVYAEDRVKSDNEKGYYIVDAINEAIDSGLKISFQYTEYNNKKRKVLRHGGEVYIVSPYALIWDGDYYYVVGFSERRGIIQNFRLDRIAKSPMILNEPAKPAPDDFSLKKYFESVFRMFSADEQVPVELLCETFIMKAIIDQFGAKVQTEEIDDNHFKATVSVCPSPTFYQWVFGWNGAMKILGPENILEEYRAMCRKGLED
ncbi:MAG: WYL domain-containing protein [Anaerolineaceae bacterium]|nr:WYL domain-containing protein [Anaerolineaceae bacterium]